jgi:hypothetical protein
MSSAWLFILSFLFIPVQMPVETALQVVSGESELRLVLSGRLWNRDRQDEQDRGA